MRTGERIRAAAFAVVALLSACPSVVAASAEDGGSSTSVLFFSGTDLWRNGFFGHAGLVWAPHQLGRDGLLVKTSFSGGTYRYNSGALGNARVIGRELTAQLMPGWRFGRGATELKLFAGADLQLHRLWPDDPTSSLRGTAVGVRAALELWSEPAPDMMLAADGSISSIAANYSARLAVGWRAFERFYLGPETQAFACDGYRQYRVGLHLTGLKLEGLRRQHTEWSLAAGWASDSDDRNGLYARLGVLMRQ